MNVVTQWYYSDGSNSLGPFDDERLCALHSAGILNDDTLVCPAGGEQWTRYVERPFPDREIIAPIVGEGDVSAARLPWKLPDKLFVGAVLLAMAGVVCLLLPLQWSPAVFWLLAPPFILTSIITGHLFARKAQSGLTQIPKLKAAARCLMGLYLLLTLSLGASILVILGWAGKEPVFLRHGWNSLDIARPALFSLAVQTSDSVIRPPSSLGLDPAGTQACQELARLITARNKIWVMARLRMERVHSENQMADLLNDLAKDFDFLGKRISNAAILDPISFEQVAEATKQMCDDSNARTAAEGKRYLTMFGNKVGQFGSSPVVQEAVQQLLSSLNPHGVLAGLAAAVQALNVSLSAPEKSEAIEAARRHLEESIASVEVSWELEPALRELLEKALDRKVRLEPMEFTEVGPMGMTYKVQDGPTDSAKELTAAALDAASLLTSYPDLVLTKPQSGNYTLTSQRAKQLALVIPTPSPEPREVANSTSSDMEEPSPTPVATEIADQPVVEQKPSPSPTPESVPRLVVSQGDEVVIVKEEGLMFKDHWQRNARIGEKFVVAAYREDLSRVFVISKDAGGHDIALSIPNSAVRAVPVDVAALLRSAAKLAEAGNLNAVEQVLAKVSKAEPNAAAVEVIRTSAQKLVSAQHALAQLKQEAGKTKIEIARLRRNAEIVDRPNPLNANDNSNRERAQKIHQQADQMESSAAEDIRNAEDQIVSAKDSLQNLNTFMPKSLETVKPPPVAGMETAAP